MLTDDDIRKLLAYKSERPNLDYKEGFAWTKENRDKKYEIVRDLMGMANIKDGGRIILGVRDNDFEFVGVPNEVYDSFDPNNVVQMAHDNSAPKLTCEIIKRMIDGRKVIVLDVAEFNDTPIICIKTINSTSGKPRMILRESAIYVRTSAASTEEIKAPDEMWNLVGRAIARKSDLLLRDIQSLLTGKAFPAPETVRERYGPEIGAAQKFLEERLGDELKKIGYIEVIAYPSEYSRRIPSIPEAREAVEKSEVSLRGWNFPHTDRRESSASCATTSLGKEVTWETRGRACSWHIPLAPLRPQWLRGSCHPLPS
jgi:hypothetical protein